MNSNLKMTGKLNILLVDEYGNIKFEDTVDNLVVTVGLNFIASRAVGTASAVMSHMGIGTGVTAPAVGQTALTTQLIRNALTSSTATNNQVTYSAIFNSGEGTGAVTEAGIFNASTSGTMLSRTTFSPVNKATGDTLTINWTITVN